MPNREMVFPWIVSTWRNWSGGAVYLKGSCGGSSEMDFRICYHRGECYIEFFPNAKQENLA